MAQMPSARSFASHDAHSLPISVAEYISLHISVAERVAREVGFLFFTATDADILEEHVL